MICSLGYMLLELLKSRLTASGSKETMPSPAPTFCDYVLLQLFLHARRVLVPLASPLLSVPFPHLYVPCICDTHLLSS